MKNYHEQGGLTLKNLIYSFKNAFRGLKIIFTYEYNLYIQIGFAILVVVFGFLFNISPVEWAIQTTISGLVIFAELTNTSIEKVMDLVQPEYDERVRDIKDLAAGIVLLMVLVSVVIGLLIYFPKFIDIILI